MQDLLIFHRNLRIEDNAALYNASLNQDYSSVFIFDKEYWSQSDRSVNQLKFALDSLNELELELKKFNVNLYVFEGSLRDFAIYMNQNHPNSNLHMNHTTETEYFSRNLKALKQNFSLSVNEYKDFGIQITNQNRDCWASDWQN